MFIEPTSLFALCAAAALATLLLFSAAMRGWRKAGQRRRMRRARQGERRAAKLLKRAGYRVLGSQVERQWPVRVGDTEHRILLRADYLVRKRGSVFVAEVKTGASVANIGHGPTRRQLLEYQLAYDAHGVLLVDAGRGSIDQVVFPRLVE